MIALPKSTVAASDIWDVLQPILIERKQNAIEVDEPEDVLAIIRRIPTEQKPLAVWAVFRDRDFRKDEFRFDVVLAHPVTELTETHHCLATMCDCIDVFGRVAVQYCVEVENVS